jgi:chitodextrinase
VFGHPGPGGPHDPGCARWHTCATSAHVPAAERRGAGGGAAVRRLLFRAMLMRSLVILTAASLGLLAGIPLARAQNSPVTVTVDAAANRHPISPNVYGVAHADATALADLNVPLNRNGGNNTSRYNWQQNADNRAADWYFESIPYASATPGEMGDTFVQASKGAGAAPMLTIPMVGWVAKLGTNRTKLASFSIAKYGAQSGSDTQWFPDAGNGIGTSGAYVTGNDPNDADVPADSLFQLGWMQHLTSRFGTASAGGLPYYILDNEPSIWHATHRDIHPTGATMDEVRAKMLDYAARVKANDPSALVVGPEEWGWSGYLFSGYDQQWGSLHGWSNLPDRAAHGGADYLPWLLDQLRQDATARGQRLVDVFSVHYYPQGGEFSDDVSTSMQLRRNRSTRSLWDPTYVDESWIADTVELVPRLKSWVATYYPGTKTAVTEYNWGAEGSMNGATAQADILGIFGREGLDLAARWTTPAAATPAYDAIRIYRNYDGNRSAFGDTSVAATGPNPDSVAAFAAERSTDGALTVMVISKALTGTTATTLALASFTPGNAAQVWQLKAGARVTRLADVTLSQGRLTATLPPQSVTLFVVPKGGPNQPPNAFPFAIPGGGAAPLVVNFSGSASSDPDGTIVSYAWTFGDGTTGSGPSTTHIYTAAGTYQARLTVTDDKGATGSDFVTISVTPASTTVNAPSNLSASVSGKTVTLRWTDNATNEDGVYVERGQSAKKGGTTFTRVGTVGPNATTFAQTVTSGTWIYRVQAFRNGGTVSTYSNQASARVR